VNRFIHVSLFVVTVASATAASAVTVKVPDLFVAQGTTEVTGIVTVSGGTEPIAGLEFGLQVGNGGPSNPSNPPGSPLVPIAISQLDLVFPGSVFSVKPYHEYPRENQSQIFPGEFQAIHAQIIVDGDAPRFVSINGADLSLVRFTLKLHAPSPGRYPLITTNVFLGPSYFGDDSPDNAILDGATFLDGSITVIPEPATVQLAGIAILAITVCGVKGRQR